MLIHLEGFYNGVSQIFQAVTPLEFKEGLYGLEIPNFNMVPDGIATSLSEIVGRKIRLTEDSGAFRKPYAVIHFENVLPDLLFVGAVAIEDTIFKTYKHKETQSTTVFSVTKGLEEFVHSNCFDSSKWDTITHINLQAGSLILFKPWLWHSFEHKLIKVFYLEVDKCENAVAVELAAKDGSSEMHTESNLGLENPVVS